MPRTSTWGGARGIDAAALRAHQLDALLFPGATGPTSARARDPTVIGPFGAVAHVQVSPFPDAFQARPTPFGVSFTGTACSEPRLLEVGYAFEQG